MQHRPQQVRLYCLDRSAKVVITRTATASRGVEQPICSPSTVDQYRLHRSLESRKDIESRRRINSIAFERVEKRYISPAPLSTPITSDDYFGAPPVLQERSTIYGYYHLHSWWTATARSVLLVSVVLSREDAATVSQDAQGISPGRLSWRQRHGRHVDQGHFIVVPRSGRQQCQQHRESWR